MSIVNTINVDLHCSWKMLQDGLSVLNPKMMNRWDTFNPVNYFTLAVLHWLYTQRIILDKIHLKEYEERKRIKLNDGDIIVIKVPYYKNVMMNHTIIINTP